MHRLPIKCSEHVSNMNLNKKRLLTGYYAICKILANFEYKFTPWRGPQRRKLLHFAICNWF